MFLLLAVIIYALMFEPVYSVVGIPVSLFEFLMVALCGWFYGIGVGIFAGLLFALAGTLLLTQFGEPFNWQVDVLIWIFEIGLGIISGWMGSLHRKIKNQRNIAMDALRLKDFAVSSSISAIAISNLDGTLTYVNPSFLKMWGYKTDKEILGKPEIELWKYTDQMAIIADALHEKGSWVETSIGKKKDGAFFDIQVAAHLVKNEKGIPISMMSSFLDITERKQAEEEKAKMEAQLQQAKKMEAIGILAGGVAHDLNNVLSAQVGYPDLILMDLPENSPLKEPILSIQESGQKAAAIVQDLLTLARRGVVIADVMNLNQIVDSYLNSPEYAKLKLFHPYITIKSDLDTDLLNIMGSTVHLFKTVMNLVNNAAEAMHHGGDVIISTQNQYIDKPVKGYATINDGDYAVLRVSDAGIGIELADIERVFEPFYTKKVMGRSGTGLGMAVVWGTVQDHKGYIDVQSTPNKGTTFILYFPVTREEITKEKTAIPLEEYMGNGESILVVDDVEGQRKIASDLLEKLDYSVTSVASGEQAVDYMKENSADLIILDMIMDPGIDGCETYKRILELHPEQKAIITSGFTESDKVKETQRLGAGKYIKKPYLFEKIGIAVKEELEK